MSNTDRKYTLSKCRAVADEMVSLLTPFCDRIIIAGSIRRERLTCSDVEVLYIPAYENRQVDFFSTEPHDLTGDFIDGLVARGVLSKRPKVNGTTTWGKQNRLAIHEASGIPVDLFATTPDNWWMSLVIRTGGKATNLRLTNAALAQGMHLQAYGCGYTRQDKSVIPCHSEREVFSVAGVPYAEPKGRE